MLHLPAWFSQDEAFCCVRGRVPVLCWAVHNACRGGAMRFQSPCWKCLSVSAQWDWWSACVLERVWERMRDIGHVSLHFHQLTSSPAWHPGRSAGNCAGCLNVGVCACACLKNGNFFPTELKQVWDQERTSPPVVPALCQAKHVMCAFVVGAHIWESMCARQLLRAFLSGLFCGRSLQGWLLRISGWMCVCVCM